MNARRRSSVRRRPGAVLHGVRLGRGVALALALGGLAAAAAAQTLTVRVEGLRSADGSIRVGFYDSAERWGTKRSTFQRHGRKADHPGEAGGTVVLTFADVPPGRYGLAVADDENDNGEIDWGLLLPKEGFGFSNYYSTRLRRPDFEEFAFDLPRGEHVEVVVRVRYL